LLFSITTFGQNGIIRGQVTDKTTGETLIGATVLVVGQTPLIATVTDYDGNFSLEDVPAGTHSIQISYVSYQKQIVENIEVLNNKVSISNISLAAETQDISEVNIVASAIQNTENSLLTIQKKSISLLNGISSQTFSKMGDSDAASAIKRVTGVTIEGGKYLFVRGLSDRYSKITLNGAEIPGLDANSNTVQLDIFSTNIIENIVVHKTFTPDLPASFAGGYVNISTKSFPTKFTLQFSTSLGFNSQSSLNDQFLSFETGKLGYLGMNDGTLSIPEAAKTRVPFLYENNNELDKITASFNKNMLPETKTSFFDHSHSFSIGNQTKLFGKPLGFIVDMAYTRKFESYENADYNRYTLVTSNNSEGVMNPVKTEKESHGEEEITTSLLAGLSYKITPLHKIGFSVLRSGGGIISARHREGIRNDDNMYVFENTLGFQERAFTAGQLSGKHIMGKDNKMELEWISSYTKSILNEPDLRFFNYDSVASGYQISENAYPAPARFYRDMNEINFDNKIHALINFENFKLRFGGSYTLKDRNSISTKFDLLSQALDFTGDVADYLSDDNIGQNAQNSVYGTYYQSDDITNKYNSYNAKEQIAGVYLMTEFKLSSNFEIQAGVRYEYDYTFLENLVESYHPKYVQAEKKYALDFLPALNLNYSMFDDMNLRFAYSRTLGRPAFREIAPYAYYDFKEGWRVVGNPDLERSMIDNLDLRWEKYYENGQILSISSFVKYFSKPIELVDEPRASNPELHYVNADNSFLYGIEIEMRKRFTFSDKSDLVLGGNFTILKSQVKYVEEFGTSNTSNSTVTRAMYGQSPWVINAFVNFKNSDLGLSSNLAFNVDGPKLAVVTKRETPDVYQQPVPSLNYNISKNIGNNFSVKFAISNILNSAKTKSYEFNNTEYIFQEYNLGRTYSISIKYLID